MSMHKKLLALFLTAAMLTPSLAFGAMLEANEEVLIESDEGISENVYAAGGNVSINAAIFGDLLTAGGNVLVADAVSDDLFAAGGSVTILADTEGDLRVAGGQVLIAGDVGGELIVAGGSVVISSDVNIGGDLIAAGGQVNIDGDVGGDVRVAGGVVSINGHVAGDVSAKIDERLALGENAVIDGRLDYGARKAEVLKMKESSVVTGETAFSQIEHVDYKGMKDFGAIGFAAFGLFKLVLFLVSALVLMGLFKERTTKLVKAATADPLKMLGLGFVCLIVTPVAIGVLFATVVGSPLAFMLLLAYILTIIIASVMTGVVTGSWLVKLVKKSKQAKVSWKHTLAGFLFLALVLFVPKVARLILCPLFLITFGSMVTMAHKTFWEKK